VRWGGQNLKIPVIFKRAGKKKKKIIEKQTFSRKIG